MKSMTSAVHRQDNCSLYISANSSPYACDTSVHRYMTSPYPSKKLVKGSVCTFGEHEGSSRLIWYKMMSLIYYLHTCICRSTYVEKRRSIGETAKEYIRRFLSWPQVFTPHAREDERVSCCLWTETQQRSRPVSTYDALYHEGVRPQLFNHQVICRWKYCVLILAAPLLIFFTIHPIMTSNFTVTLLNLRGVRIWGCGSADFHAVYDI